MMKKARAVAGNYKYHIPMELFIEILSWLPVNVLGRYKCVSKSWCSIINDPKFIKLHLRRSLETHSNTSLLLFTRRKPPLPQGNAYSFNVNNYNHVTRLCYTTKMDPPSGFIVSSCNGLLCLAYLSPTTSPQDAPPIIDHYLYNPVTGAIKLLPLINFTVVGHTEFHQRIGTMALGYDYLSDDFKILKIAELWNCARSQILAQRTVLYSSKADAWELIDNPPWSFHLSKTQQTVFANNSFHWLTDQLCKEIKCFNISTRRFYEKQLPERASTNSPRLTVLQGQLCLVTCYLDIWILKEYTDDMSWTQVFCNLWPFNNFDMHQLGWDPSLCITCLKSGTNIFLAISKWIDKRGRYLQKFLICCNLESETADKIDISGLPDDLMLLVIQPWVESLVDPLALSLS